MQVAWLHSTVLRDWMMEAEMHYPLETGGVLIGYWANPATAVVTHAVGAGPRSVHRHDSYDHDHEWESSEIALYYERSRGSETYLGDWHTHPDARSGDLSALDRRSLRRIIASPSARTSRPLMTVLFGDPHNWTSAIWLAELKRFWLFDRLIVYPVTSRVFEDSTKYAASPEG